MTTIPQPISTAKRLIGTYVLIDVEILKNLNDAIANKQIALTELRVILASWYIHTLYAEVSPDQIRRYIKRHITKKEAEDTFARYQPLINPALRKSPKANNRKVPKKLVLTLVKDCTSLEIGLVLLCCTQGSARHRFTFLLGQRRCAGRFKVSTQAIAQALQSLVSKQILIRSAKQLPPAWGYQYRFDPSQLKPCLPR